ncbi:hypothetical protein LTR53_006738 [Teratosphaeriaceae sp. CCFEE 6253]|nr:hypothetical protein LTR53_006738 [Teratosphaeriaceae sp. CCFEE 6253]
MASRTCVMLRASDPRDCIYALIGMTNCAPVQPSSTDLRRQRDDGLLAFPIDYTMSISQVFQHATKCILNSGRTLNVFDRIGACEPLNQGQLPSWTVDRRCLKLSPASEGSTAGSKLPAPSTSGHPATLLQWQDLENDGLIRVRGFIRITIDEAMTVLESEQTTTVRRVEARLLLVLESRKMAKANSGLSCRYVDDGGPQSITRYPSHQRAGSRITTLPITSPFVGVVERLAAGDVIAMVEGTPDHDAVVLRPAPDGRYTYVCPTRGRLCLRELFASPASMTPFPFETVYGALDALGQLSEVQRESAVCWRHSRGSCSGNPEHAEGPHGNSHGLAPC